MSDWGSGYIVDAAYVTDFCGLQAPSLLAFAALCSDTIAPGGSGEPIVWCDLGCGQGYTANVVAAANPAAQVFGFDFHPGHIANARAMARAGGLSNVEFVEASFEELLANDRLPQFDIICMHGIFSWISAENRRILVALLRRQLKPGGLLYIAYDCLPGWASFLPLRDLFPRHFSPGPGVSSASAAKQALDYVEGLRAASSRLHEQHANVEPLTTKLKAMPGDFIAHEILTRDWKPFSFSEMAATLAEAKLSFLGSANVSDGIAYLNFTEQQQAFLAGLSDPVLAEATRDLILLRNFRRDIFVKGPLSANAAELNERWLGARFALTTAPDQIAASFETPLGKFEFDAKAHVPFLNALSEGPMTLREAIAKGFRQTPNPASLADAIRILVARGIVQPALPADGENARAASTRAFNGALLLRAMAGQELSFLASPVTGGGVRVDRLTQLYLQARREGLTDLDVFSSKVAQSAKLTNEEGAALSFEQTCATLRESAERIHTVVAPHLASLGIDGASVR